MKTDKKIFLLILTFLLLNTEKSFSATPGQVLENQKFTAVVATKNQENKEKVLDYSEKDKPINALVVAAYDGKNEVTVKGNGTVSDTIANQTDVAASKWKNFDGTEVKAPEHWTIVKEKPIGYVSANRYKLESSVENAGLLLADKSYKGHNDITLENVSIKTINSRHSIFGNQTSSTSGRGMSDTTITFKGTNYLFTDGSKVTNKDEINGIEFLKNDNTLMNAPTKSHTHIKLEKDSTLNIYTVSGTIKARGIGTTHYRNVNIKNTGPRTTVINQTEMDFYGAVNIKVDRGNMMNAENYGVYVGGLPKKVGTSDDEPEESYDRVTFYGDVKIDVQPVLDENGKQKSIGDALNVDGKNSKIEVKGDGKVQIDGDIHVINGSKLELNLKNEDSYFHGEAHIGKQKYGGDPDDPNNPPHGQNLFEENRDGPDPDKANTKFNFTITNGARWDATNTSKINNLNISNGATVTFSKKRNMKISVENLTGTGGVFNLQVDIKKGTGDLLQTRKSSEGVHKIKVKDQAGADVDLTEHIKLVENLGNITDNKATFKAYGSGVEMGPYIYHMGESDHSKLVDIKPDNKRDFYIFPSKELTAGAKSAIMLGNLLYQLNALNIDTLVQRMGEVHFDKAKTDYNIWSRYINGKYSGFEDLQDENYKIPYWGSKVKNVRFEKVATKNNNIWVKNMEGEFTGFKNERTGSYSNRYRITKVGFDFERLRDNWINYGGVVFSNINSNTKFLSYEGKNEIKGMSLGLYSTWLHKEKNIYYDFVANVTNYKSRYDVISASGDPVHSVSTGSLDDFVHTNSFTFSAEAGKRILLKEEEDKTYYVQPEGQLVYQFTKGYKFNVSNGLRVNNGDLHGLLTRVGLRAGIDSKNKRFNSYVKLMYEAELLGNSKTVFNEKFEESTSNRDHWLTYGIGLTTTTKKGKQIYFEAQRSTKHKVRQDWQLNLGIRFNF